MQVKIVDAIRAELASASQDKAIRSTWGEPIVGFADAADPLFGALKRAVRPSHSLPGDLLRGARTVIAYFLPFDREIARTNHRGVMSSEAWAVAYVETNRLIARINDGINTVLERSGYRGTRLPATHNFDQEMLMSDWSHKHIAYIAGIGRFGHHHMLITEKGCCGRLGSVVTDAVIPPTTRPEREYCLYKHDGSCRLCEKRCPAEALSQAPFHRHACYHRLMENAEVYERYGLADVCGKCAAIVPCSFHDPVARLKK